MGLLKLFCRLAGFVHLPSSFLAFLLLALLVLSNTNGHTACEQPGTEDMIPASLQ